ncbi:MULTISPECIES: hypothetical protein [Methanoculleus]|nr:MULTISPECIES: hypothetical protein [unclassified Methanoculleus]
MSEIPCRIGGTGPEDENFTLDLRARAVEVRTVPAAARVVVVGEV